MKGRGPGNRLEIVCPDFDTYAEYEIVDVPSLGSAAKQGGHVLIGVEPVGFVGAKQERVFTCACGRVFNAEEAGRRDVE